MYQHNDTRRAHTHTADGPQPGRADALRLALAAADAGLQVFPLRGKAPAIPKRDGGAGVKDASSDRSRVHGLFNRAGRGVSGYGIATGAASGRIVVDIDGPDAQREADRLGLASGYIVRSGRENGGRHLHYTISPGVAVRSRTLAAGLELKADGAYVVGPGSWHPSGRPYRIERGGEPAPAPAWLLEPDRADRGRASEATGPVSIDTAGEPIPDGGRNKTLARIAGRLHDGTRSLPDLERDLLAINEARCTPPLAAGEVQRIAASIYRREPCNPRPRVSDRVLSKIEALRRAAEARPVRGRGGATGWAIYHAGLELAREHGRDHPDGFTLAVDRRTWGQMAATDNATVTRWLRRSPLVEVIDRGSGRRSSTVLFRVPIGCYTHHSTSLRDSQNNSGRSDADNTLFRNLYRSRWTSPERKPRRGVVPGTRKVRQSITPRREGTRRMGKSCAALLDLIRRNPDAPRRDLARLKGVKPASLTHPLRTLREAGLIVRTSRGRYAAAADLAQRIADARELGAEPQADREQIARDDIARARHRYRLSGEGHATPPASEAAYRRSRERHERENARPANATGPTPDAGPLWRRVSQLEGRGMARRFAVREVFGPDSREHRDALTASARAREAARLEAARSRAGGAA